jgi:hypothetical protein
LGKIGKKIGQIGSRNKNSFVYSLGYESESAKDAPEIERAAH